MLVGADWLLLSVGKRRALRPPEKRIEGWYGVRLHRGQDSTVAFGKNCRPANQSGLTILVSRPTFRLEQLFDRKRSCEYCRSKWR